MSSGNNILRGGQSQQITQSFESQHSGENVLRPKTYDWEKERDARIWSLLAKAPDILIREESSNKSDKYVFIYHPLLGQIDGAEIVLMKYRKRAGGKRKGSFEEKFGKRKSKKKGYCVASGSSEDRFVVQYNSEYNCAVTTYLDVFEYLNDNNVTGGRFGLALRIDNPNYTGPETIHKNATYKGTCESWWSDIKKINIYKDAELFGIGIDNN